MHNIRLHRWVIPKSWFFDDFIKFEIYWWLSLMIFVLFIVEGVFQIIDTAMDGFFGLITLTRLFSSSVFDADDMIFVDALDSLSYDKFGRILSSSSNIKWLLLVAKENWLSWGPVRVLIVLDACKTSGETNVRLSKNVVQMKIKL